MKVKTLKDLLAKHDDEQEVLIASWAHGNVDLLHDVNSYEMVWRQWFNSDVTCENGSPLEKALATLDNECESDPDMVVLITKPLFMRDYPDWIDQDHDEEPEPVKKEDKGRSQDQWY